jgi:F0F1-type ATP synthase assembly protein I
MASKNSFKTFYAISWAWQLGFLIAVPLGCFLALGFWIDKIFNTAPFFLILGIIVGLVTAVYEVYHSLIPLIREKKIKGKEND